jgi:hypothetical protein
LIFDSAALKIVEEVPILFQNEVTTLFYPQGLLNISNSIFYLVLKYVKVSSSLPAYKTSLEIDLYL